MRKLISFIAILFVAGITTVNAQCCNNPKSSCSDSKEVQSVSTNQDEQVKVIYFHATRRCATCEAVEKVAKETVQEVYGDKVVFESINREEDKDNPLIKEHKITGQSLIIIKGDKAKNLTNYAFMNARTKPEKLKKKIQDTIDSLVG
jgi:hypothetical protein